MEMENEENKPAAGGGTTIWTAHAALEVISTQVETFGSK